MLYWRAWCGRPLASVPGGITPMDWPSSTGKGMAPKSSITWCVSYSRPTCVTRTLPTTVAVTVFSAALGP
jgi:hypothetical protein